MMKTLNDLPLGMIVKHRMMPSHPLVKVTPQDPHGQVGLMYLEPFLRQALGLNEPYTTTVPSPEYGHHLVADAASEATGELGAPCYYIVGDLVEAQIDALCAANPYM